MWCVAPFLLLECNYSMEQISLSYINLLSLERETLISVHPNFMRACSVPQELVQPLRISKIILLK